MHAAQAAIALGCPLVTLHSRRWTSAREALRRLPPAVTLIAIDVRDPAHVSLPRFETSRLVAGKMFDRRMDLSAKRNLALKLSHMLGWERVVFIDDDIQIPNPDDLRQAARLLDTYNAVGLGIGGYPDNSVVCHAFRIAGGDQETFIGGGALAVEVKRNHSFFPDIYNDDWFYVLDAGKRLQPVATTGQVTQNRYDPFRNPGRARAEEFGDVLAEGTFWLLDQGKSAADADWRHWRDFLERRQRFIRQVLGMVAQADRDPKEQARIVEALKAGAGQARVHQAGMVRRVPASLGSGPGTMAALHPAPADPPAAGEGAQVTVPQGHTTTDLPDKAWHGHRRTARPRTVPGSGRLLEDPRRRPR